MFGAYFHCYDIPFEDGVDGFLIPPVYYFPRPRHLSTIYIQIWDWFKFLLTKLVFPTTWMVSGSDSLEYSSQMWTIPVEFWTSLLLFLAINGLAKVAIVFRLVALVMMASYSLYILRWDISLFLWGSCIAELSDGRIGRHISPLLVRVVNWTLFWSGLYFASYPDTFASDLDPESKSGLAFAWLDRFSNNSRFWQAIGAVQIVWAVTKEEALQKVFGSSFASYFGRISFALYLVHVPMLQTWGWIATPTFWAITGKDSQTQKQLGFSLGYIFCTPLVIWSADLFCRFVDEPCIKLAKLVELWCFQK